MFVQKTTFTWCSHVWAEEEGGAWEECVCLCVFVFLLWRVGAHCLLKMGCVGCSIIIPHTWDSIIPAITAFLSTARNVSPSKAVLSNWCHVQTSEWCCWPLHSSASLYWWCNIGDGSRIWYVHSHKSPERVMCACMLVGTWKKLSKSMKLGPGHPQRTESVIAYPRLVQCPLNFLYGSLNDSRQ